MQHIEQQQEEPILSDKARRQKKVQHFKQYLVDSGCVLHFVKFMLGVRSKQKFDQSVPSEDPLQMFKQYIGAIEQDTSEQDQLRRQIEEVVGQNEQMKTQIQQIQQQIQAKKQELEKKAQEARLREEEQAAKNAKKGAKK